MDKNTKIILGIILVIGLFYISKNTNLFEKDTKISENKQGCSQYEDLINKKIQESERVLKNEKYILNEIFYSPQINTCLYAFTVEESDIYGGKKSYYIYDFFKEAIFSTRSDTDFQVKIISLKR